MKELHRGSGPLEGTLFVLWIEDSAMCSESGDVNQQEILCSLQIIYIGYISVCLCTTKKPSQLVMFQTRLFIFSIFIYNA